MRRIKRIAGRRLKNINGSAANDQRSRFKFMRFRIEIGENTAPNPNQSVLATSQGFRSRIAQIQSNLPPLDKQHHLPLVDGGHHSVNFRKLGIQSAIHQLVPSGVQRLGQLAGAKMGNPAGATTGANIPGPVTPSIWQNSPRCSGSASCHLVQINKHAPGRILNHGTRNAWKNRP